MSLENFLRDLSEKTPESGIGEIFDGAYGGYQIMRLQKGVKKAERLKAELEFHGYDN